MSNCQYQKLKTAKLFLRIKIIALFFFLSEYINWTRLKEKNKDRLY